MICMVCSGISCIPCCAFSVSFPLFICIKYVDLGSVVTFLYAGSIVSWVLVLRFYVVGAYNKSCYWVSLFGWLSYFHLEEGHTIFNYLYPLGACTLWPHLRCRSGIVEEVGAGVVSLCFTSYNNTKQTMSSSYFFAKVWYNQSAAFEIHYSWLYIVY